MSKSDYFENAFLLLTFNGAAIADIAENDSSSPATTLTVALHTADPGDAGDMATNEASYTGYARQTVNRNSGGFTVTADVVATVADVVFPASTGAGTTLTHFSIGTGVGDNILYKGTLTPTIPVADGTEPKIVAGAVITGGTVAAVGGDDAPDFIATLGFNGESEALTQTIALGTDMGEAIPGAAGWWLSCWVYVSATPTATRAAVAISDATSSSEFFYLGSVNTSGELGHSVVSGAERTTPAGGAAAAGWHLITAHLIETGVAGRYHAHVYVDGATATQDIGTGNDFTAYTTLSIGSARWSLGSGTTRRWNGNVAGVSWGTGDPTAAHAWAYNTGTDSRQMSAYDFASDANAGLGGAWQFTHDTVEGVDVSTHAADLVDSVAALDSWTEYGTSPTVEWGGEAAPFVSVGGGSAPVHSSTVPNLSFTQDVAITPIDFNDYFTGTVDTWTPSVAFSAGLSLSGAGVLSGTPTDENDDKTGMTVNGLNAFGNDDTNAFDVSVSVAAPVQNSVNVPVGATNTITIEEVHVGENWTGPYVYDQAKMQFWAERYGFGKIGISSISESATGSTLDVTLTLDRTIYVNEEITFDLQSDWVTDDSALTGAASGGDVTNSSADTAPATGTKLSFGRMYWEFDAAVLRGHYNYPQGMPWAAPVGTVGLTDIFPVQTTVGGLIVNGAMKNPVRLRTLSIDGYAQAYDERTSTIWAPTKLIDPLATTFAANDSFIFAEHDPEGSGHYVKNYAGCVFLTAAPAANEVCPPLIGYDGTTARPVRTLDMTAVKTALPSYSTASFASNVPPLADIEGRICQLDASPQCDSVVQNWEIVPQGWTSGNGYGRNYATTTNAAALALISDFPVDDKEKLIGWIAFHGCQWYDAIANSSLEMEPDGGHTQGKLFLMVAALWMTGQTSLIGGIESVAGGSELTQTFIKDAAYIAATAPHLVDDATVPLFSRRRDVTAVSGLDVTCGNMSLSTQAVNATSLFMKRLSDGATAIVTTRAGKVYTIDAQPSPAFAVGDEVYLASRYTEVVDQPEWGLAHSFNVNRTSPNINAAYRRLQNWIGAMLALKALGLMHPNFEAFEKYVEAVVDGDYPTASYEYTFLENLYAGSDATNYDFDVNFYGAHWTAISSTPAITF